MSLQYDNEGPGRDAVDRDRRRPGGSDPFRRWSQRHQLLLHTDDDRYALGLQVGIHHPGARAAFQCVVLERDRPPVAIAEDDIEVPADRWEFRASGLWVELVCETPWVHWSYGLEAFALSLDDELELLDRGYGDRVALGWEFEFHADPSSGPGGVEPGGLDDHGLPTDHGDSGGYRQEGMCEGLLLFDSGPVEFAGRAERFHHWGLPRPGRLPDGVVPPVAPVALPTPNGVWWVGRSGEGRPVAWFGEPT